MGETAPANQEEQPTIVYDVGFELIGHGAVDLVGKDFDAQRQYGRDFWTFLSDQTSPNQILVGSVLNHRHDPDRVVTIMGWMIRTRDLQLTPEAFLGQATVTLVDWLKRYNSTEPELIRATMSRLGAANQVPQPLDHEDYTFEVQDMLDQLINLASTNPDDFIN